VFASARWRLALWFAAVLAVALTLLGLAVYLTVRHMVLGNVDDELRTRAERELPLLNARLRLLERQQAIGDVQVGPEEGSYAYMYALLGPHGQLLAASRNLDPTILPPSQDTQEVLARGPKLLTVQSHDGEEVRIYLRPVGMGPGLVLLVGRSLEPELSALHNLLVILLAGGVGAILLSVGGGYFLAGRALRPIKEAMERQRTFMADASHELRTPLSLIRASAEILQRHPEEPISAHRQEVEDIIGESERLARLVSQLLTLARADAGRLPLHREEVDLAQLARDAVRQLSPRLQEKGLQGEVVAPGPVPLWGDATRLRELLFILLDNAIKFTPAGGRVEVRAAADGDRARLEVADTGVGIDPQDLPRIFDRFYRADRARRRDEDGGAGLGLAIAKAIVEAHGGRIWAESQLGRGATFVVVLPRGREGAPRPVDTQWGAC